MQLNTGRLFLARQVTDANRNGYQHGNDHGRAKQSESSGWSFTRVAGRNTQSFVDGLLHQRDLGPAGRLCVMLFQKGQTVDQFSIVFETRFIDGLLECPKV